MTAAAEGLQAVSEERIRPDPAFAVSESVWAALRSWDTRTTPDPDRPGWAYRVCGECVQAVNTAWTPRGVYRYSAAELEGLLLAHLIQRHGWSRETSGA